jgi:hypothetical protein
MAADVVVWLVAELGRVEELAWAATPGPWEVRPPSDRGDGWELCGRGPGHNESRWVVGAESGGGVYDEADARFVVATDPVSVLRRVAADRQILAEHQPLDEGGLGALRCSVCAVQPCGDHYLYRVPWPCRTVLLLAEGYGWAEEST